MRRHISTRLCITAVMTTLVSTACRQPSRPAASPCLRTHGDMCLVMRIPGTTAFGELGFRFGPPRDVNGDGVVDIAAGARFTKFDDDPTSQAGEVYVWSGSTQARLTYIRGRIRDGLLGHSVVLTPDLNGDGRADMIAAGPTGRDQRGSSIGTLIVRSVLDGEQLWTRTGDPGESFGWDLAVTQDHDGDDIGDVFVGAPSGTLGKVFLLSGRTGDIIRTYASNGTRDQFGWYVSELADIDGDGYRDLGVGAPLTTVADMPLAGKAYVLSSATGEVLYEWRGRNESAMLGEIVCGLPDINGDGVGDIAISATYTRANVGAIEGEVFVHSGADGRMIYRFQGRQKHELYGRMVVSAGDYDRDGVGDIAIGAPWYAENGGRRAGRIELRSGRTGAVLLEMIGDADNRWLGWHMEPVTQVGTSGNPGLLISLIGSEEGGVEMAGALELYEYRRGT